MSNTRTKTLTITVDGFETLATRLGPAARRRYNVAAGFDAVKCRDEAGRQVTIIDTLAGICVYTAGNYGHEDRDIGGFELIA